MFRVVTLISKPLLFTSPRFARMLLKPVIGAKIIVVQNFVNKLASFAAEDFIPVTNRVAGTIVSTVIAFNFFLCDS